MLNESSEPDNTGEDEIWVSAYFKTGDNRYWGKLFDKYKKQIFLRCVQLLQDYEDARDMTSETFVKAYDNIQQFDIERPFFPWLFQIATNLCIDRLRRNMLVQFNPIDEQADVQSAEDVSSNVENSELRERILAAINNLRRQQKRCFCLFYIHRKSYKEIAELTGYSYNNVRSFIQNGKRKFKLAMQE